jgi:hypothetical protein
MRPRNPTTFSVSPLLQALIVEAAAIEGQEDSAGYAGAEVECVVRVVADYQC